MQQAKYRANRTHLHEHMFSNTVLFMPNTKVFIACLRFHKIFRSLTKIVKLWSFHSIAEEKEKPADLTQRIVFKVKRKGQEAEGCAEKDTGENSSVKPEKKEKSRRKNEKPTKNLLSFAADDDEG